MDLKQEAHGEVPGHDPAVEVHHRQLDQVGSASLDHRVDRQSFPKAPGVPVGAMDLRDVAPATKDRGHIPMVGSLPDARLEEAVDAGKASLVVGDQGKGAVVVQVTDPARQSPRRDAVDDPEIDGLGLVALVPGNILGAPAEDLGSDGGVDVQSPVECVEKAGILRQMGKDAQLDLRIVGTQQDMARRRVECLADLATLLAPHRDVLQVRRIRREAAGGGPGLPVRRVDASVGRVDGIAQGVQIGRDQLLQLAVLKDHPRDHRVGLRRVFLLNQLVKHFAIGTAASRACLAGTTSTHG